MRECYKMYCSRNSLSSEDAEESVQKNRRQLQEQIQIKSDSLSIIFQKMYKLEYLSKKCACPNLAEDSIDQVSFPNHDAALIVDEIDRMQHELNDVDTQSELSLTLKYRRSKNKIKNIRTWATSKTFL